MATVRTQIPVTDGHPQPEQVRKWMSAQIPYKNFAGGSDDIDNKVAQWVQSSREGFYNGMGDTLDRWATNWAAANGESLWGEYEDDVHVPETKKACDAKVARVEEAIFGFDPLFEVEGVRGDIEPWKGKLIGQYVYRLMELAEFRDYVQPSARDAELCNISAIKIAWEHVEEMVVNRKTELRQRKDGSPYYHDERSIRMEVARSGPVLHLVDPFLFFYDLEVGRLADAAFVGDTSKPFLHEIEAKVKHGYLSKSAWDKLSKKMEGSKGAYQDTGGAERADMLRQARSITMLGPNKAQAESTRHMAGRCVAIEMWGWFDFGDGIPGCTDPNGRPLKGAHRCMAVLVNGQTMRFSLNPFDKKFVPYAIDRINRNGHEMVAPSPFDHVVPVNAQYDRAQSTILRNLDLSNAPYIVAPEGHQLGESILGKKPGSVLRDPGGGLDVIKMPDTSGSVPYFHNFFRREIEEASGALRIYESPQGTATETERKVQEQQRMVRSSIRGCAEQWRQVARIIYWMSGQFATRAERFKVSGKGSSWLNQTATITPDVLQEEADFRFLGPDNLHVLGNRQAGLSQWMQRWGPQMMALPDFNPSGMAKLDFELTVGRYGVSEVFTDTQPAWASWPQEDENEMLRRGIDVPVHPMDDDLDHIKKLAKVVNDKSTLDYVRKLALTHMQQHVSAYRKKAQEKAALQAQADEMHARQGGPGVDEPPEEGGMQATPKGQTPGPPQSRTVAKPGRSGDGMSQSQSMQASSS